MSESASGLLPVFILA